MWYVGNSKKRERRTVVAFACAGTNKLKSKRGGLRRMMERGEGRGKSEGERGEGERGKGRGEMGERIGKAERTANWECSFEMTEMQLQGGRGEISSYMFELAPASYP